MAQERGPKGQVSVPTLQMILARMDRDGSALTHESLREADAMVSEAISQGTPGPEIAQRAIVMSPLCAEAYIMMAETTKDRALQITWARGALDAATLRAQQSGVTAFSPVSIGPPINGKDPERALKDVARARRTLGCALAASDNHPEAVFHLQAALSSPGAFKGLAMWNARDVLIASLLHLRHWNSAWQRCLDHPDGPGAVYGRLLAGACAGSMPERKLEDLADECIRTNRYVVDVIDGRLDSYGSAAVDADPGSIEAARAYVGCSAAVWTVHISVKAFLRARMTDRLQGVWGTTPGERALSGLPVREVLEAMKAGPRIMQGVSANTMLGEMLVGDWLCPPRAGSEEPDHEQLLAHGPHGVGFLTAREAIRGLKALMIWGRSQTGDGRSLLARYVTERERSRRRTRGFEPG